jgi:serine/threonine-protein kinase
VKLNPGDEINRTYSVGAFVGAGAFGEVYRVTHKFLGLQALKVLGFPTDIQLLDAFSEARVLVDLSHPNIVRTYDANVCEEAQPPFAFMTMEYARNGTLSSLLDRELRLSEENVYKLGLQLSSALAHTHMMNPPMVHQDVKPSNVLVIDQVTDALTVKLSDYGLAKPLDSTTRLVTSGGTAAYAAPEAAWGVADERSDVYSLGVTLYRCLTGIHPYPIQSSAELSRTRNMVKLLSTGRRSIAKPSRLLMRPATRFDEILMTCLEYDMFKRFRNALELYESLQAEVAQAS